jgi:hypothetical protein
MAIVAGAFFGSFSLLDGGNDLTTKSVRLVASTFAEAEAAAAAHLALLDAVTDATIVGYEVKRKYEENAIALPAVTVRNSIQAVITASIQDQPLKKATVSIPAPNIGCFNGATGELSDVVDANPGTSVDDYLQDFTSTGNAFLSDSEHLDTVTQAKGIRVSKYRRLAK